ncbi:MAG: type II secretion system protein [Phycisphaerales bacterium JB050]
MTFINHQTRRRRGITILEVIVSLVLMVGIGSMVLSAFGYLERAAARDRIRLAAYEAAHRIVLQFIDDPDTIRGLLDSSGRSKDPVFVNGEEFGFKLTEDLLVTENNEAGGVVGTVQSEFDLETLLSNKLKLIHVEVSLNERKAGFSPMQQIASIDRIYNIMNNPETLLKFLRDQTAEMRDNE